MRQKNRGKIDPSNPPSWETTVLLLNPLPFECDLSARVLYVVDQELARVDQRHPLRHLRAMSGPLSAVIGFMELSDIRIIQTTMYELLKPLSPMK